MGNVNDWRLNNQETYLKGVALKFQPYAPSSANNDHDHCEFCLAKFMVTPGPEILTTGYATVDRSRWICEPCFNDFAERFGWKVAERA
jgi:hypothetical protein